MKIRVLLITIAAISFSSSCYATAYHKKKHHHRHHYRHHLTNSATTNKVATVEDTNASKLDSFNLAAAELNNNTKDTYNLPSSKNQPRLYSYSALVLNADNRQILVNKNSNKKMPIASISKLMTAMVLLDSGADLNQYVEISANDIDTLKNTYSRLRVGMELKRKDLLLLALMSSENRAAYAIARTAYPGGINVFIQKMNAKAKSLGMINTQFYDPTGLTKSNQSTAADLAKMVQAAFNYPLIREDTTTKGADVLLGDNWAHHYMNSDALVRTGKMDIALSKTGFINEAGHCLVLYSFINKKPIIMVFLNSSGKNGRIIDAMTVRNYITKTT
ncbi:MAG: serine hydrolase [Burkholderiales bacterium]|nr:serine hydrolase [Burkholderiales bacterium]